ncbi:MAG: methyltransferase domain-containing protein, partial [Gemmatimonadetes bacterium]|nr:methyltransferase domain-containing protein [Gemmatimonadota bacterium]
MYRFGDYSNLLSLLLMILLAGLPFFFAGLCIGFILSRAGENVGHLYFSDLIGAACGAVAAVVFLTWIGGTATCLAMGTLAFLAAALSSARTRIRYILLFLAGVGVTGFVAQTEWLTLYAPPDKPLFRRHAEVERIEWHPIARVDVTRPFEGHHSFGGALAPNWEGKPPLTRLVFQDGGALTGIVQPDPTPEQTAVFGQYMQSAAYSMKNGAEALVIGCGGGVDVQIALHHNAKKVTAVDVNPEMLELLNNVYADFAKGVFQRDDVELIVSEGRHFLTSTDRKFDVIQMSGVDTYTALAAGAYALTENFIYTREAVHQYLDHLNPDGIVSITRPLIRPPRETLKLTVTAVDVLSERGIANPEEHVIILAGRGKGSFFGVPWGLTMIKESPFSRQEVADMQRWAGDRNFSVAYAPYGVGQGILAKYLRATPPERVQILEEDTRDMTPATDDRPFFFHFYPWSQLVTMQWLSGEGEQLSVAAVIMQATLFMVTLLSTVLILLPLFRTKLPDTARNVPSTFLYFASLGLGFILIEIALLQKLTIFLGGPTYSMAVTLFSVLFFSGIGSFVSKKWSADPLKLIAISVPLLAVLSVVTSLFIGPITDSLLGLSR